jgi:glycosidase
MSQTRSTGHLQLNGRPGAYGGSHDRELCDRPELSQKLLGRLLPWLSQLTVISIIVVASATASAQNAPDVLKVEPPNWWAGHSVNPVRVLIRGRNLTGARVEARGDGIKTGSTSVNKAGTYLFVDLAIDRRALPGPRPLTVSTRNGTAVAPFEISAPLARAGRFQGFTPDDFIYLIMPDRFSDGDLSNDNPAGSKGLLDRTKSRFYHGGDLQGVIDHLDYLKGLGVTAIWLTPVYANVDHLNYREQYGEGPITDYHGYGAVDFYSVDEHLGTIAKLKELADRAHQIGIKVIQDQVANHTGPYHPWVSDPPTPTWFNGTETNHLACDWQIWTLIDPGASYQLQKRVLEGWFVNILPDLNQNDPETARYLIQNTLWWLGMIGFDAIREDTVPYVPRAFWGTWARAIKKEYPNVNVLGEVFDGNPALVSFFQGGRRGFDGIDTGIETLFDYPLYFQIRSAFGQGRSIREVARVLASDWLYTNPSVLVTFFGDHDVPRFMSEKGADIAGLLLAYTFVMTARGTPLLYYGDEIAMNGGGDPDNRRDFPGGFPGDSRSAFARDGRSAQEETVFQRVQKLAALRADLACLRRGKQIDLYVSDQQYAYARVAGNQSAIIVINNDLVQAAFEFEVAPAMVKDGGTLCDQLGTSTEVKVSGSSIRVEIPARSAAIYTLK